MSDYTLIHNPRCSKSRQTLELLKDRGIQPQIVLYLEEELSVEFLREIFEALEMPIHDCLREKEEDYKNLKIDKNNDEELLEAIIQYPKILERPIFINGNKAVIGRPPENILKII